MRVLSCDHDGRHASNFPFVICTAAAAGRGHHVDVVPAVAVADERDPLAVGRRLAVGAGIVGDAPELLVDVLVLHARRAAGDVGDVDRAPLEVGRPAVEDDMPGVEPAQGTEGARRADRDGLAAGDGDDVALRGRRLRDRVDDLRPRNTPASARGGCPAIRPNRPGARRRAPSSGRRCSCRRVRRAFPCRRRAIARRGRRRHALAPPRPPRARTPRGPRRAIRRCSFPAPAWSTPPTARRRPAGACQRSPPRG